MTNIVLVSWDSVRADHLSIYGYDRLTTPSLTRLANSGLVFEDTFVSGVGTPTSFTGAFTGKYAHGIQTNISPEHWKQSNKNRRFLQEALQDAGYYTGAVHANPLVGRHYGWDRGWNVFKDDQWTKTSDSKAVGRWHAFKKSVLLPTLRKYGLSGLAIHAKNILLKQRAYAAWESLWPDIEQFISTAPEPWFLWVLLVDTHHPWTAPEEYQRWSQPSFRRTQMWNYIMRRYPEFTGVRKPAIVNAYDNELVHADAFLDKLQRLLAETGNLDIPLIVHSDHGDELGEHGDYGHSPAMWDTVTYVPLIMQNVGQTGRVAGPHSLLNLGSTILDLADSTERLNGQPSYFDDSYQTEIVYIENREQNGMKQSAITDGEWKITYDGFVVDAYNRLVDPDEQQSRITDAPIEIIDKLSRRINLTYKQDTVNGSTTIDPEIEEQLINLGYK